MPEIPTIKVIQGDTEKVINLSDFDPKKHRRADEPAPAPKPKAETKAKTKPRSKRSRSAGDK